MKIIYVARHGQLESNDDEGAVAHALRTLGHEVYEVQEERAGDQLLDEYKQLEACDFILFHKWPGAAELLKQIEAPAVFWYFDLVDFPDPVLGVRCRGRVDWMRKTLPYVSLGFCTDGTWVAGAATHPDSEISINSHRLVWLMQGADQRVVGFGNRGYATHPLLLTGIGKGGGRIREDFVKVIGGRYGRRLHHVERGLYGRALADTIANSHVVLAPDGPVTDQYWSNRVYTTLGFGGFLLHPYCAGLAHHYVDHEHLVYYADRPTLYHLIEFFSNSKNKKSRDEIAEAGMKHTAAKHTYLSRCQELLRVVKERIDG